MDEMKGQLTVRGVVIGCIGCVIITAASLYTALKMGALPWPIIFVALVSLFFLRIQLPPLIGSAVSSLSAMNAPLAMVILGCIWRRWM